MHAGGCLLVVLPYLYAADHMKKVKRDSDRDLDRVGRQYVS